ncbi:MAG: acyl-ACP--UDP-N-acetylglucosamine O-acyltransferase [Mariprofundaceae bacterium]
MSFHIHPTAIVASEAQVDNDVIIGPYCVIGAEVRIGKGSELMSHVVIAGRTSLGENNRIFPFASIGHEPQDLKYHGEASEVIIGNQNTIRENVTVNPGTEGGGMVTRIGNGNMLMAYAHVAHDCILGDNVILANCATLAGHVEIDDGAIIGGLAAIHQFVRIGRYTMMGGMCGVNKDVPPYCLVTGGYRAGLGGLNLVGLKRQGFSLKQVQRLKEMYRILLQESGKLDKRLDEASGVAGDDSHAQHLLEFVRTAKRGVTMHGRESE